MRIYILLMVLMFLLLNSSPKYCVAQAESDSIACAILEFDTLGIPSADVDSIVNHFRAEIDKIEHYHLISHELVNQIYNSQHFDISTMTGNESRLRLIGKLLNAHKILTGVLAKISDMYIIKAVLINVGTNQKTEISRRIHDSLYVELLNTTVPEIVRDLTTIQAEKDSLFRIQTDTRQSTDTTQLAEKDKSTLTSQTVGIELSPDTLHEVKDLPVSDQIQKQPPFVWNYGFTICATILPRIHSGKNKVLYWNGRGLVELSPFIKLSRNRETFFNSLGLVVGVIANAAEYNDRILGYEQQLKNILAFKSGFIFFIGKYLCFEAGLENGFINLKEATGNKRYSFHGSYIGETISINVQNLEIMLGLGIHLLKDSKPQHYRMIGPKISLNYLFQL